MSKVTFDKVKFKNTMISLAGQYDAAMIEKKEEKKETPPVKGTRFSEMTEKDWELWQRGEVD